MAGAAPATPPTTWAARPLAPTARAGPAATAGAAAIAGTAAMAGAATATAGAAATATAGRQTFRGTSLHFLVAS